MDDPGSRALPRARASSPPVARQARELARQVLWRVEADGAFASRALSAALDRVHDLAEVERGLATELVYGVLRRRARLDRALEAVATRGLADLDPQVRSLLRVGAYQLLFLDRIPAYAAVNESVEAAKRVAAGRYRGLVNALLRRVAERGEPPLPDARRQPSDHLIVAIGFPPWLAALAIRELGSERAVAVARDLTGPSWLSLRANPLAGYSRATLQAVLAEARPEAKFHESRLAAHGLLAENFSAPASAPVFAAGGFAIQDVGAQVVAELCGAAPGERVLDACAGVGGKTAHLAALADNRAHIEAWDISAAKLSEAAHQLIRLRVKGVRTRVLDLTHPMPEDAGMFHRVLLDAPCSGLGVLRRHPEALLRRTEADLGALAEIQRRMLEHLASRVLVAGSLVYAVCTFDRAETDAIVDWFLETHPDFELDAPGARTPGGVPRASWRSLETRPGILQTWPSADPARDADGFFAARFRRVR